MQENRLYGELASWFYLLTSPDEYEEETSIYSRLLEEAAEPLCEASWNLAPADATTPRT
jgi:hypothetical protein